jgi:hypothetical protein
MKKLFDVTNCLNLIRDAQAVEVNIKGTINKFEITTEQVKICWALSKMTVKDLEKDFERS